uniref:Probable ATP-dependent RNA helicase DDX52 n=1 Tax=Triatoma dimidiata TaxID=72491 RepID=A0A0V0G8K0_TRIDM
MDSQDIFNKLTRGIRFNAVRKELKNEIKAQEKNDADFGSTILKKKVDKNRLEAIRREQVAHFRNINGISASGKNIPDPIKEFIELKENYSVSEQIINNLNSCGYKKPTPVQMQIIPAMLSDREILACAPTGSGKTAAFLVPLLAKLHQPSKQGFRVLILCPTRELSKQILRECILLGKGTGIVPHCIRKVSVDDKKFGPNFSKKFDILITTPNRLIYLLNKENSVVSFSRTEWLIIDESDKLFEPGIRSFRDQLEEIERCCNENIKKAMFSATYTAQVAKWCHKNIKNILSVTVGHRNTTVQDVEQDLVYVGNETGKLIAFRDLVKQGLPIPALVFVQSKERAKQLFNELIFDGINVDVIHADRTQLQRDNVVKAFREGKIWVLICTELMGRGIDFKGVKLVINFDFPPSAISYIHRIGRTGRAGRSGKAITYFTDDDKPTLIKISKVIRDSGGTVPEYLLSLKSKKSRKKTQLSVPSREPITTEMAPPAKKKFKKQIPDESKS